MKFEDWFHQHHPQFTFDAKAKYFACLGWNGCKMHATYLGEEMKDEELLALEDASPNEETP